MFTLYRHGDWKGIYAKLLCSKIETVIEYIILIHFLSLSFIMFILFASMSFFWREKSKKENYKNEWDGLIGDRFGSVEII